VRPDPDGLGPLRSLAARVIAPVVLAFVLWTLRQAELDGLERLWFVSRDGQLPAALARRVAPRLGLGIDIRYLYGGRQAWHLPALQDVDEAALRWILQPAPSVSLRQALARVELRPVDMKAGLAARGWPERTWERPHARPDLDALRALFREEPVRAAVLARAAAARGPALDYLADEGVGAGRREGLVDIGWFGRTWSSLGRLLGALGRTPPRPLYFGLLGAAEGRAFLVDHRAAVGLADLDLGVVPLLETFCQADHGPVLGYEHCGPAAARPVLGPPAGPEALAAVRAVHAAVLAGAAVPPGRDPDEDIRPLCRRLLGRLWQAPTRAEACALSRLPLATDQRGEVYQALCRPYRWIDLAPARRRRADSRRLWPAGSLAMSPAPVRWALRRS
jgi:hypothetical protein